MANITKTILITGGLGYLGGRIANYLDKTTHKIILASRKISHAPAWLPNIKIRQINWHSYKNIEQICRDVDIIIHAAGMNADDCKKNPMAASEFNGNCTKKLIDAATKNNVKRFFYFSTAHVYSSSLEGFINEKSKLLNSHPYATSHKEGEEAIKLANKKNDILGVNIRLSNGFGAPMDLSTNCWALLFNDLCKQAIIHKKMILKSNANTIRNFIPVSEICRAIEHLIHLPKNKFSDFVFNLGSDWSPSLIEVSKLIQDRFDILLGFRPQLIISSAKNNEEKKFLNFRSDLLINSGFLPADNKIEEIDRLIKFCQRAFSK